MKPSPNIKKPLSILTISVIIFSYIFSSGVLLFNPQRAHAATYTVTNNADSGAGSLRQAILDANTSVGVPDVIEFAIGSGQQSIAPVTPLPVVSDTLTIDGTTQPGGATCGTNFTNRNLLIEINGTNDGTDSLLRFDAGSDGSTIKGLVINRSGLAVTGGLALFNSNDHIVQCNNIGTNFAGTAGLSSQNTGIGTSVTDNLIIGGINPGEGNIVSGNASTPNNGDGIRVNGSGAIIRGNYVGVGANGECIGNGDGQGIGVTGDNNIIGGNTAAARNVVSCHTTARRGDGIEIVGGFGSASTGNIVQGNYVGTNIGGQVETGYGNSSGIIILADSENNLIGGAGVGDGNVVAGNGLGIGNLSYQSFLAINNSILGNKIFTNTGGVLSSLGIDNLQTNDFVNFINGGVTLNDADDIDYNGTNTGSNHYLNFPVINSITSSNGQVTINYDLDINDAEAGATGYRVEFFANDAADPSGYGEGQTFLGYENVAGDVTGQSVTLTLSAGVEGNKFISATTTMIDNSTDGFGHTSEFGALVEGNLVPTGSVTPAPAATLASTGRNSSLLLLISFMVVATGGVGLYKAIYKSSTSSID